MSGYTRLSAYLAFAVAGFRRHSTYRQATVAACVTNSVFGFLRAAVMLAVLAAGGNVIAGYDAPKLMTFVWAGQGLIGTVLLWTPPELAPRLVRELASGRFDALAGRYIHAEHDPVDELEARVDRILAEDLNAIRLRRESD